MLFVSITSTIGTLQLFDESFILTGGGPDNATITIGHYLYNTGFPITSSDMLPHLAMRL